MLTDKEIIKIMHGKFRDWLLDDVTLLDRAKKLIKAHSFDSQKLNNWVYAIKNNHNEIVDVYDHKNFDMIKKDLDYNNEQFTEDGPYKIAILKE